MTPKVHLYELIRSLSRSEILAFREFAGKRKKQALYLRLFDLILGMEVYDEDLIRKKFKGKSIVKNLSNYKSYLYQVILDSLRQTHKNDATQLSGLLEQIIILKDKGFYHHTPPLFHKAITLASKQEDFGLHLKLLDMKQEIARITMPFEIFVPELDEMEEEMQRVSAKNENLRKYNLLLNHSHKAQKANPEYQQTAKKEILSNPLMSDEDQCLSTSANVVLYSIRFMLFRMERNFQGAIDPLKKVIGIYEAHPDLLLNPLHLSRYLDAVHFLGIIYVYLNNFEAAQGIIEKYDAVEAQLQRYPSHQPHLAILK